MKFASFFVAMATCVSSSAFADETSRIKIVNGECVRPNQTATTIDPTVSLGELKLPWNISISTFKWETNLKTARLVSQNFSDGEMVAYLVCLDYQQVPKEERCASLEPWLFTRRGEYAFVKNYDESVKWADRYAAKNSPCHEETLEINSATYDADKLLSAKRVKIKRGAQIQLLNGAALKIDADELTIEGAAKISGSGIAGTTPTTRPDANGYWDTCGSGGGRQHADWVAAGGEADRGKEGFGGGGGGDGPIVTLNYKRLVSGAVADIETDLRGGTGAPGGPGGVGRRLCCCKDAGECKYGPDGRQGGTGPDGKVGAFIVNGKAR